MLHGLATIQGGPHLCGSFTRLAARARAVRALLSYRRAGASALSKRSTSSARLCDLSDERAADLMRVAARDAAKLASWYPGALPGHHPSPVRGGQPCLDPGQVPWPRGCRDWLQQAVSEGGQARLELLSRGGRPSPSLAPLARESLFSARVHASSHQSRISRLRTRSRQNRRTMRLRRSRADLSVVARAP